MGLGHMAISYLLGWNMLTKHLPTQSPGARLAHVLEMGEGSFLPEKIEGMLLEGRVDAQQPQSNNCLSYPLPPKVGSYYSPFSSPAPQASLGFFLPEPKRLLLTL